MLYNPRYLPSRLWSVTCSSDNNLLDHKIESTWTTRAEARSRKQELLALGFSSAKIISQRVEIKSIVIDSHS